MKIVSNMLKNTSIVTESGKLKVDANGIVEVPEEIAKELIDVGSFVPVEEESKESSKEESKAEKDEAKTDNKKGK